MPERPDIELAWLCELVAALPLELRKSWIARRSPISIKRQCELLGISRSTLYYKRAARNPLGDQVTTAIRDKLRAEPRLGSRRLTQWLRERGYPVNRKRVIRLLRLLAAETDDASEDRVAGVSASRAITADP